VLLNGIGGSSKGKKMGKMTQEVGRQKCKGQVQMWTMYEPWCVLRSKIRHETNRRRIEYEWGNSAKDYYGGFGNEKNVHKDGASNLDK
jgi:hypothetical protein